MQNSHYTFFKIKFINKKITKIDYVPKLNIGVIMGYGQGDKSAWSQASAIREFLFGFK